MYSYVDTLICMYIYKHIWNVYTYIYIYIYETLNSDYICLSKWVLSCSVMSDSLRPHGLSLTKLLCSWDFPGKNTWVGCHFLLWGIFPIQGLNLRLLCPALQADSLATEPSEKPIYMHKHQIAYIRIITYKYLLNLYVNYIYINLHRILQR